MSNFEIYSPYICFSVRLPLPYHEFQCLVSRYTVHVWGLSLPPQCLPNTSLINPPFSFPMQILLHQILSLFTVTQQSRHLNNMHTNIPNTTNVIRAMNTCFNHWKLGNQEVNLFHISLKLHERSSLLISCRTLVCFHISSRSVEILPL